MGRPRIIMSGHKNARRLGTATARYTAPLRMSPGFLIVGAQRCGTTSMFKTLMQHPLVARPFLNKGIHYFDTNYDRGFSWYRGHFPVVGTARLRRGGRRPLTGESSPYYMFHPLAGQRLATDLPQHHLLRAHAGQSGGQTHRPLAYPAGDFRCNQRQPEIKDRLVGIEVAIDSRDHPFTFSKHDPHHFGIPRLHRRP
jgi:hypothetical protein